MQAVVGALRAILGMDTSAFDKGVTAATKSLNGLAGEFRKTAADFKSIGSTMALAITAPVVAAGALTLKAAADFESGMNRVQAATQATAGEFKALTALALEMGKTTGFSATESAGAIEALAKNGASTTDILNGAAVAVTKLAAANGGQLAPSADIITDTMNNFHKTAAELPAVVDGVTGALIQSKFGFDDYRLAIGQAAGVAGKLGVSFEDFNAAIAATSSAFSGGSDAGTSFKTFLQRLVPQSTEAAQAMAKLGLNFYDAKGKMLDMAGVAEVLKKGFGDLSDKAKTAFGTRIFGTDAIRTALGLAEQGAEGLNKFRIAIEGTSAADQAAVRLKGFNGAMKLLQSSIENLSIAIANSGLLEWATAAVGKITDLVRSLATLNPEMLKFGTIALGISAAVGPALIALGVFSSGLAQVAAMTARILPGAAALVGAVLPFARLIPIALALGAAFGVLEAEGASSTSIMINQSDVVKALSISLQGAAEASTTLGRALTFIKDGFAGMVAPRWLADYLGGDGILKFAEATARELDGIVGFFAGLGNVFDTLRGSFASNVLSAFGDVAQTITTYLTNLVKLLANVLLENLINPVLAKVAATPIPLIKIDDWQSDMVSRFVNAGRAIGDAFNDGFKTTFFSSALQKFVGNAADQAFNRQAIAASSRPSDTSGDSSVVPPTAPRPSLSGSSNPAIPTAGANSLANALQRIAEERKALDAASAFLKTAGQSSQELLFQAADELARIGAKTADMLKGQDPGSATGQKILAQVTALEQARTAYTQLQDAIKTAFATEQQYGDGIAAHTETMRQLNAALATGKVSQDAYTEAVRQANFQLQDQQNKAIGAKGGFDAFMAGFADSANQAARNNSMFEVGKQGFQEFTGAISEAGAALFSLDADVGQILQRMLQRIAQFAFDVLVLKPIFDQISKMISESLNPPAASSGGGGGGLGGILGAVIGGIGSIFGGGGFGAAGIGGVTSAGGSIIPWGGTYASGGPVSAGSWYSVNEKGQGIIPGQNGTIIPHDVMSRLGSAGGNLTQINNFAVGVRGEVRAEIASQLPDIAKAGSNRAKYDVGRGGNYAKAFGR